MGKDGDEKLSSSGGETGLQWSGIGAAGAEEAASRSALRPFSRLSQSSVEALRYRGEDIARSLTSKVVNEVGCSPKADGKTRPGIPIVSQASNIVWRQE